VGDRRLGEISMWSSPIRWDQRAPSAHQHGLSRRSFAGGEGEAGRLFGYCSFEPELGWMWIVVGVEFVFVI